MKVDAFRLKQSVPEGVALYGHDIRFAQQRVGLLSDATYPIERHFDFCSEHDFEIYYGASNRERVRYSEKERTLMYTPMNAGMHEIRQLVAFAIDRMPGPLSAVHASGIIKDSKGVLLIGRSGSGKSTIASRLNPNDILDDDLLLIDAEEACVVGHCGAITRPDRSLHYQRNGRTHHAIHIVFLLEKTAEGGVVEEMRSIPRTWSVIDALSPIITKEYLASEPIRIAAPIHRLGTRNNLPKTLDIVLNLIEKA